MADSFYIDSDYVTPDRGYYLDYTEVSASLTASASISCSASLVPVNGYYYPDYIETGYFADTNGVVAEAEATLSSSFSTSTTATVIKQFSSYENILFSTGLTAKVTKNEFAGLNSSFSLSSTASVKKSTSVSVSAAFTESATGKRTRNFSSYENILFSTGLTAKVTKNQVAVIQSSFSLSSSAVVRRSAVSNLSATASQSTVISRTRHGSATFNATASISAKAVKTYIDVRPYTLYAYATSSNVTSPVTDSTWTKYSTVKSKYGTGSLFTQGYNTYTGEGSGAFIGDSSSTEFNIPANTDFYISFWTYFNTGPYVSGTMTPIIKAQFWSFGFHISNNSFYPYFSYGGGGILDMSTTGIPTITAGAFWDQWEAWRVGNTLYFKYQGHTISTELSGPLYGTGPLYIGQRATGVTLSQIYFDELFISVGTHAVQNTLPSGEINDGGLSTTKLLYHFNGDAIDDVHGFVSIAESLNATTSVTANVGKAVSASANLSAQFSQSTAVNKINSVSSSVTSSATLTATQKRYRGINSAISSTSSLSTTVSVTKGSTINIGGVFVSSMTIVAIRNDESILMSSSSMSATGRAIRNNNIAVSSAFSIATDASRVRNYGSSEAAAFTISANNLRVRYDQAAVVAAFSLACTPIKISIIQASASLSSTFSTTNTCEIVKHAYSTLSSNFAQTVQAIKNSNNTVSLNSTFVQTSNARQLISCNSSLSATFAENISYIRIRSTSSTENALFTQSLTCNAIRFDTAGLLTSVSLSAQAVVRKGITSSLSATFTEVASPISNKVTSATLNSQVTLTALGSNVNRTTGDLIVRNDSTLYTNIGVTTSDNKFGSGSLQIYDNTPSPAFDYSNIVYDNNTTYLTVGFFTSDYPHQEQTSYTYYCSNLASGTWTKVANNLPSGASTLNGTPLTYMNGYYTFASNGTVYRSSNGITWSTITSTGVTKRLIYNNGLYITANGQYVSTSTNLTTWTTRYNYGSSNYSATASAQSGTTTKIAFKYSPGGGSIVFLSSTNGTGWTGDSGGFSIASTPNAIITAMATDGTNWVAVGSYGLIARYNGTTWSKITTSYTDYFTNVTWNGSQFVAYTNTGLIVTSSNGSSWSTYASNVYLNSPTKQNNTIYFTNPYRGYYGNEYQQTPAYSTDGGLTWTRTNSAYFGIKSGGYIAYPTSTKFASWKTLDFWIKDTGYDTLGGAFQFVSAYSSTDNTYWNIGVDYATDGFAITLYTDTGINQGSSKLSFNIWHHVRYSYDGTTMSLFVDGSRVATVSNSSVFGSSSHELEFKSIDWPHKDVFIDEFLITDDLLTSPSATTYTVPTQPYTNTANTKLLLHFNGDLYDDASIGATRQGQATLTTSATLYALPAGKTSQGNVSLSSTFTETTTASKTVGAVAALQVAASELTVNGRLRAEVANLDVTASLSANIGVIKHAQGSLNSTAQLNATVTKNIGPITVAIASNFTQVATIALTRQGNANLQVQGFEVVVSSKIATEIANLHTSSSLLATVQSVKIISSDLTSTFSCSATGSKDLGVIQADLSSTSTLTATARDITANSINLNASFAQTVTYRRYRNTSSNVSAQATLTGSLVRVTVGQGTLTSTASLNLVPHVTRTTRVVQIVTASELAAVAKIGRTLIDTQTTATLSATGIVSTGSVVHAYANFTETASAKRIARARSVQASTFGLSATPRIVKDNPIFVSATATLSTSAKATHVARSNLTATATLTAQARVTRSSIIVDLGTFTQTVSGNRTRKTSAQMAVSATIIAAVSRELSSSANLHVVSTVTASGSLFSLDPELTYRIPKDVREYTIEQDNLDYKIAQEILEYIID